MALLDVRHLAKSFGNSSIFQDLSFTLEQGEVLVVWGPSGSGKTTLLRCLNFLETADRGSILLNGETLWDEGMGALSEEALVERRVHFGLVFQQFHLFPQYTVKKNVTLAPSLLKRGSRAQIEQEADEILAKLGLSERAAAYPYQLSGGQKQRVAIGRAMALKPEILCLDEPTSALDPALVDTVVELVGELKAVGQTLIVITHDRDLGERIADQFLELA